MPVFTYEIFPLDVRDGPDISQRANLSATTAKGRKTIRRKEMNDNRTLEDKRATAMTGYDPTGPSPQSTGWFSHFFDLNKLA